MEDRNKKSGNNEWLHLFRIGLTVFLTFACCIIFYFLLLRFEGFAQIWGSILTAATPIIIGLVLAYILNPVMLFIEDKSKKLLCKKVKNKDSLNKISRTIGVIGATLILIGAISLFIAAVVPSLTASIVSLVKTMPANAAALIEKLQNSNFGNSTAASIASNVLQKVTDSAEDLLANKVLPQAQTYVTTITKSVYSVVKGIMNFVIGIIVMVYAMTIQDTLRGQAKKIVYAIFKPIRGNLLIEVVQKANQIFGGFISGKILDSFIIGIIAYIGCLILRIPSAILVAVFIGVTNIIPVFGPFIGAIPSLLLVLIQSPWHALYLLIFIIVLQQVDGNIIGPKILGSSTGLSSFWVMFAILIGGGLFGFMGMLLGVPVFATMYYIIKRIVSHALKKRELPVETSEYVDALKVDISTNKIVYETVEVEEVEDGKTKEK